MYFFLASHSNDVAYAMGWPHIDPGAVMCKNGQCDVEWGLPVLNIVTGEASVSSLL